MAGLLMNGLGWVRPVSRRKSGTLYERDYVLKGDHEARILDVISVEVAARRREPTSRKT